MLLEEEIMDPMMMVNNKIILVSNREPFIHNTHEDGVSIKKAVGGLTTALDPLMQKTNGLWVAWGSGSADFSVTDDNNKVKVPPEDPKYQIKRVALTEEEKEAYYRGYANQVLWPLFHCFIDKIRLEEGYWEAYQQVNEKFTQSILEEASEDNYIWIHDYHLALVPSLVRQHLPKAKIAMYWHIPWPPWEIFGALPQRDLILNGLLDADVIGFHTNSYVINFLRCCERISERAINKTKKIVWYDNHDTQVYHFPLGINYSDFSHPDNAHEVEKKVNELKDAFRSKTIILGIDRLDYTKGILDRLLAFELFLEQNPEFHEKVVLVQIATPSRYEIDEYHNMKKNIDETVGGINSKYRSADWTPVKYFYRMISQELLLAFYQVADVALLTPIRDGMNLIAKEYIASRKDPGVLILSEFAGASEELNEAIIVNPYDIQSTADALKTSITMSKEEIRYRFNEMKKKIIMHDSTWWLHEFLEKWVHHYQKSK